MQEDFNSIKVRLKPGYTGTVSSIKSFQFHKGTIKTYLGLGKISKSQKFQFHKGTIKTIEFTAALSGITIFQFHKGTIKTASPV